MRILCVISISKYVPKGRDCGRNRTVGTMGSCQVEFAFLKAFNLTNLRRMDIHWIFGIWGNFSNDNRDNGNEMV